MKISELNQKSFLSGPNAASKSYVLINYEDDTTNKPRTYRASLEELSKAIVTNQNLYKKTVNGAVTLGVSQGAYANSEAENFATQGYVDTKTNGMVTTSNISQYISGLASTGAVTSAVNNAVNGLASTGYVTAAVANAGENEGFTNPGDIPVYVDSSSGNLVWYNWEDPSDSDPYPVVKTNGYPILVYDSEEDAIGYYPEVSSSEMIVLNTDALEVTVSQDNCGYMVMNNDGAALKTNTEGNYDNLGHPLFYDATNGYGYYDEGYNSREWVEAQIGGDGFIKEDEGDTYSYLFIEGSDAAAFKDEEGTFHHLPTPVFYSYGDQQLVDIANNSIDVSGSGDPYTVTISEWNMNYLTYYEPTGQAMISDFGYNGTLLGHPIFFNTTTDQAGYYDQGVGNTTEWHNVLSGLASTGALATKASIGAVAAAVQGLASTGYVTSAISTATADLVDSTSFNYLSSTVTTLISLVSEMDTALDHMESCATLMDVSTAVEGLASTGDVTAAVSGLASTGYVTNAISGLASTGDVSSALVHHLYYDIGQSTILVKNMNGTTTDFGDFASKSYIEGRYASIGALAAKASTGAVTAAVNGLASTGYVTNAVSGLASTGYVTAAVANAGGGNGLNPLASITCSIGVYYDTDLSISAKNLYPAMILIDSTCSVWGKDEEGNYLKYLGTLLDDYFITHTAQISTSDNKPCIRDYDGNFIGFLSAT